MPLSVSLTFAPEDLVLVGLLAVPAAGIAFVLARRGDASRAGAIITMIILVLAWWALITWTSAAGPLRPGPPGGSLRSASAAGLSAAGV